jgi:hypothetical protein
VAVSEASFYIQFQIIVSALEFYYWDSLWIIKGLMVSGMYDTGKLANKIIKKLFS